MINLKKLEMIRKTIKASNNGYITSSEALEVIATYVDMNSKTSCINKKTMNTKLGIYDIHMNYNPIDLTLQKDLLNFISVDKEGNYIMLQISSFFKSSDFPEQDAIYIKAQAFKNNKQETRLSIYLDVTSAQFLIDNLQNIVDKMKAKNSNEEKSLKKEIINDPT